jgi:hypothetical protein
MDKRKNMGHQEMHLFVIASYKGFEYVLGSIWIMDKRISL